jgi:hypothetical protein
MLDDARLRVLGEMGIDVYVPRSRPNALGTNTAEPAGAAEPATHVTREGAHVRVALVARVHEASEKALLAQARRALAFAGIDGVIGDAVDISAVIGDAPGWVVFGKNLAREVGAALPADRARRVHWISAADVASIVGDADAKRALWSELRRMIRVLRNRGGGQGG